MAQEAKGDQELQGLLRGAEDSLSGGTPVFRAYFASLRLAFALVCVGVSLLLGGQWLGFLPDVNHVRARAQQDYCEAVSLDVAGSIRRQQWTDLEATLNTLVDHNEELLSIGVRTEYGRLRLDTGHHEDFWLADPIRSEQPSSEVDPLTTNSPSDGGAKSNVPSWAQASPETDESAIDPELAQATHTVEVPITLNRRHWGTVEFAFAGDRSSLISGFTNHSLLPLVCFFSVAGLFSYTMLMARVMGVFRSTQVVPDRVRGALDTLAEGLLVLDDRGRIVLANQAFSGAIGIASEDLNGRDADDLEWSFDAAEATQPTAWRTAIDKGEVSTGSMVRYKLSSGEVLVFSVNSSPLGGDTDHRGALVTFRDVTHIEAHRAEQEKMLAMLRSSRDEIRRKNRELELLATQDSLTGCFNRRAFFERFETLWKSAHAEGTPLACLMFDNDHFKSVNDTYGHHIGDEVLRHVSKTIRDNHEAHHLVCRYGGEEFCVVLPGCDLEKAQQEAEKTRRDIMAIRLDDPNELRLTASIGVSELVRGAKDPQELINQADACLYIAKQRGRNRVVAYEPGFEDMQPQPEERDGAKPHHAEMVAVPFQAVTALLGALSYRDSDTAEHSCRVADLCVRTAEGLLPQRDIYTLEVAALLHDIGKIGVPDHVLLKPGKLTAEEWRLMEKHDDIGASIIEGTFGSPDLSKIIRSHHAFYDGNGRQKGLPVGEAIPLSARILTIADSYDAMVSDRVYRAGRSHEQAIEELRRCAGTQFDPVLVEAFIAKINPGERERPPIGSKLSKHAALRIGIQIEHIADAMDSKDTESLRDLAVRLGSLAQSHQIEPIAHTALKIEQLAVDALEKAKSDSKATEGAVVQREGQESEPESTQDAFSMTFQHPHGDDVDHACDSESSPNLAAPTIVPTTESMLLASSDDTPPSLDIDAEDRAWLELLKETNELLDLCRATQSIYVGDSEERNKAIIQELIKGQQSAGS